MKIACDAISEQHRKLVVAAHEWICALFESKENNLGMLAINGLEHALQAGGATRVERYLRHRQILADCIKYARSALIDTLLPIRTSNAFLGSLCDELATGESKPAATPRMMELERDAVLMRKELEIAAGIQNQINPQVLPEFPGLKLAARTMPCSEVGGDFYDVIAVENGFVALVGDASGKGVAAALLASMVQGMLHAQLNPLEKRGSSLVEAVKSLNGFLCLRAPAERYVTLAILRYRYPETEDGLARVELVNGGHTRPIVVRADGTLETIEGGDMPVGILDIAEFHAIDLNLAVGERIVILSDGITEAENPAGIMFGETEMEQYLRNGDPVPALFDGLKKFCQEADVMDDRTVLTIDRLK